MDQNKSHSETEREFCQDGRRKRGFSLPILSAPVSPMPRVNPSQKEETVQKRKKSNDEFVRSAVGSKEAFLAERNNNPYMIAALEQISRVVTAQSTSELQGASIRLERSIASALNARIPTICLTTILQELSNQTALYEFYDGRDGGVDALRQQRISILTNAFTYLDGSY